MRLRTTRDTATGDVYVHRDDLVAAMREAAPAARTADVTDALRALADLLGTQGGPATPRAVVGGQLWTPDQADRAGLL